MNIPHSVSQRLKNIAKELNTDFNLILTRYGVERLLFRLSNSKYRDSFVLKGASMFLVWQGQNLRVTRDVDLLGYGDSSPEYLTSLFETIITIPCESDGLTFDTTSLTTQSIKEEDAYNGVRITVTAYLGNIRIPVQIDIGFGDAVTPDAIEENYPTLLKTEPIHIKGYSRYTLAAEKIEALVKLGIANSRMKDFYDLCVLSRLFEFDGNTFSLAITNTFQRRDTIIPESAPFALTKEFYSDASKNTQWHAFIKKAKPIEDMGDLQTTIQEISPFILPLFDKESIPTMWVPRAGWQ